MPVKIDNYQIGDMSPPFIVAEMSANHGGSLERALQLVDAAADIGVHALKIQTYTADTMTLNISKKPFFIDGSQNPWKGQSLHSLYSQAATPWDWHKKIFQRCRQRGLIPFSTPFDSTAIDFLQEFDIPCYKIAAFENSDLPLIRKAAATGKPLIISTGMATVAELDETVRTARDSGCKDLVLLKCTSTYPASPNESNLRTIPHMRKLFRTEVGLSDHTAGIGVSVAAVSQGATVIEKHFTLSKKDGAADSAFSMEPDEMRQLVNETQRAWESLGSTYYGPTKSESDSLQYRRSLYAVKDINAGDTITSENVRSIRPGGGLEPKHLEMLLGKKAAVKITRGTPLSWAHFVR